MIFNKNIFLLFLIALALCFGGCAKKQPSMYYFGNSQSALYAHKKEPTDESFIELKQSMENIIDHSQMNGMKIPPGTFANLGYLNLLEQNDKKAVEYFNSEKHLYPEATIFMDRMINKVKVQTATEEEGESNAKG